MSATVLAGYGNELNQVQPPVYAPLKPNQQGGRLRTATFSKTFASEAAGLNIALALIPRGSRIIGGQFQFSASLGGTTTVSLGLMDKAGSGTIDTAASVSDNVAALYAATALTATTKQEIAATQALKYGYETEKDLYLTLTTAAGSMGTQVLQGHVTYVLD